MLVRRIVAAAFGLALAVPVFAFAQEQTPAQHPRGINAREHRQVQRSRKAVRTMSSRAANWTGSAPTKRPSAPRNACIGGRVTD
jgi:hypothetical protein